MTSIMILLLLASTGVLAAVEAVIVTIGSIQTVLGVVEAVLVPSSSSSPHVTGNLEAGVSAGLVTSGLSGLAPLPLTVPVTMMAVMTMFVSASSTLTLLHLVIRAWHL